MLFMAYKTPGATRERRRTQTSSGSLILHDSEKRPNSGVIPAYTLPAVQRSMFGSRPPLLSQGSGSIKECHQWPFDPEQPRGPPAEQHLLSARSQSSDLGLMWRDLGGRVGAFTSRRCVTRKNNRHGGDAQRRDGQMNAANKSSASLF